MALTPNFSASQTIGLPSYITLSDTSTGTDGTITTRRVYFTTESGSFLVTSGNTNDYESWTYSASSKTFDVLPQDYALSIVVQWYAGSTLTYSKTILYCFTLYSETFYYGLTQNQTSTPNIVNDTNYYNNKMILRCSIDEANNAVDVGGDITSSQSALERAYQMISNENDYF